MTDEVIRQAFEDFQLRILTLEQMHEPSTYLREVGYSHLTPDKSVPKVIEAVREPNAIQTLKAEQLRLHKEIKRLTKKRNTNILYSSISKEGLGTDGA